MPEKITFKIMKHQVNVMADHFDLGDEYIVEGGCPTCGADLKVTHGVAVQCVNWQHPNMPEVFAEGGERNCDYALLSG